MGRDSKTTTRHFNIPHDILYVHVLPRLPVKTLCRFKCVSKKWLGTIIDPDFAKLCLTRAQPNPTPSIMGLFRTQGDDLDTCKFSFGTKADHDLFSLQTSASTMLVGHCSGVFCFAAGGDFLVCNPSTHEVMSRAFPPPPPGLHRKSFGFGCDHTKNEYKVVQIVHSNRRILRCAVFILGGAGNGSWREIAADDVNLSRHFKWRSLPERTDIGQPVDHGRALYVNGELFWFFHRAHLVMALDLHSEKFRFFEAPIPQPAYIPFIDRADENCLLIELRGDIYLSFKNKNGALQMHKCTGPHVGGWCFKKVHVPYDPFGALGAESLMYSVNTTHRQVFVRNLHGDSYRFSTRSSAAKRFPVPPASVETFVSEYHYAYHVENLLALETPQGKASCSS